MERRSTEVRTIVAANVDPQLLKGVVAVGGSDLRFTPADERPRHAGILVLRYPTAAIATLRLGTRKTGFFHDTKILTPMTITRSGTTIVVFFSESGGDPAIRALLSDAAQRLI